MKYEGPYSYKKDVANVKVFLDRQTDKRSNRQKTGQKLYARGGIKKTSGERRPNPKAVIVINSYGGRGQKVSQFGVF